MISVTTNKATYTGDGSTTEFVVTFPFGDTSELKLFLHDTTDNTDTEITSNWGYNNPTGLNPYGSITYPSVGEAIASTKQIVIIRSTALTQEKDHTVKLFTSEDVEGMADKLTREVQDVKEIASRSIQYPASYTGSVDANYYINELTTLKDTATTQAGIATNKAGEAATSATNAATSESNASKWAEGTDAQVEALGGTHSSKNWAAVAQAAAESEDVQTVAANIEDVQTVAGIQSDVTQVSSIATAVSNVSDNDTAINTVYDNLSSVIAVSGIKDDVTAVSGIKDDVTAVSGIKTAVTNVNSNSSNINAVAGNESNINAVATNESNINAVNSNKTNIDKVAGDISRVKLVADDIESVHTVAVDISTVIDVAANKTNIDAVAGNATNINAVASNATNINAVNANKTNIDTVAGIAANVTTVATNAADIGTIATNISDVTAVANDLTDINAVADDLTNIDLVAGSLSDIQDKQNKTLTTSLTIGGVTQTTVEGALGALNEAKVDAEEWHKPSDWMDIRSGALPNSVYFLVGHSSDYSTYPKFEVTCSVSNASNTYDVFVDGVKVATTAGDTKTTLTWQTLALTSGFDVTHPSALRTHIVRVTPTSNSDTLTSIAGYSDANQGVLWAHSTCNYHVAYTFGATNGWSLPIMEAITCSGDTLLVTGLNNFVACATSLVYLPKLKALPGTLNQIVNYGFYHCYKLPKIHIIGMVQNDSVYNYPPFQGCDELKEIIFEDCQMHVSNFVYVGKLIRLPSNNSFYNTRDNSVDLRYLPQLQDTFIDCSDCITAGRIRIQGRDAITPDLGKKWLIVSNEAPFDGNSPQINVAYTGLNRAALVNLFKSMPYNIGYTVVGSPTIVDGVASGFSDYDYVKTSGKLDLANATNLEIYMRLKTPASFASAGFNMAFRMTDGVTESWVISTFTDNGITYFSIFNTDLYSYHNVATDTWYRIKVTKTGTSVTAEVYSDSGTLLISNSATITPTINEEVAFGGYYIDAAHSWGSIDFNETYIKVNGVPWFTGKADMTKTCSVVGCTGTADLTQTDKDIALDKGWALTVA